MSIHLFKRIQVENMAVSNINIIQNANPLNLKITKKVIVKREAAFWRPYRISLFPLLMKPSGLKWLETTY